MKQSISQYLSFAILFVMLIAGHCVHAGELDELISIQKRVHALRGAGKYQEAIPLALQVVARGERALTHAPKNLAIFLNDLAILYDDQGKYAEAEPLYLRAMKIREKALGPDHPKVADSLNNLAILYKAQSKYAEAESLINRAISIKDRAGVGPDSRYLSYLNRSRIEWGLKKPDAAMTDLRRAMDLAEQQRVMFSGAEQERAKGFEGLLSAFEQMIVWQQKLGSKGDLGEVILAIERSRSRSLLDDLNMAGADLDKGRSAEELERLRKLESEVKSRAAQLEKQFENAKSAEQRARLLPELAKAREAVYQEYRDRRASSPVYRQLLSAAGQPIRLQQLQQTLTPEKSLLLVYFLGDKSGYVVSIQSDKVQLRELSVNDEHAKILGCSAGPLTSMRMQSILMNDQKNGVLQKLSHPDTAEQAVGQLAALWPVLIPESQREGLLNNEWDKLLVVPDGPLSSLPFEALVVTPGDSSTYLLDVAPPIQYGPSATVLFNLKQRVASKEKLQAKPVLTVANPQYGKPPSNARDSLAMLTAGARYAQRGGHLQQLPYSGTEAAWLYDTFTKGGIGVGRLLEKDATEANIRFNLPGRKIVHLACHGLVDREYGNFFGSLAVTPGPKADSDPSDDGFITLAEINQLDLKQCELAILSACETNFGPHQKGEGTWAL